MSTVSPSASVLPSLRKLQSTPLRSRQDSHSSCNAAAQAERVEVGRPKPVQHLVHQLLQFLRRRIGTARSGEHAGAIVGRAVAQQRSFHADRGAALAELVMQFARQRPTLAFLQRDQLLREFALVRQQVGDARLGLFAQVQLCLEFAPAPQGEPDEAAGQRPAGSAAARPPARSR